ncbi:hypothetical protein [Kribbella qitaiheensis]|nr:hypothetical protein [Kribbella qitaiheensis]
MTSARVDAPPTARSFDREALSKGVLRASVEREVELVSLGLPAGHRW